MKKPEDRTLKELENHRSRLVRLLTENLKREVRDFEESEEREETEKLLRSQLALQKHNGK